MTLKLRSKEVTCRTTIYQVIFSDDEECVVRFSEIEGLTEDPHVEVEWVTGETPEWAEKFASTPFEFLSFIDNLEQEE